MTDRESRVIHVNNRAQEIVSGPGNHSANGRAILTGASDGHRIISKGTIVWVPGFDDEILPFLDMSDAWRVIGSILDDLGKEVAGVAGKKEEDEIRPKQKKPKR